MRWESDWEDTFAQRACGPAFYRPFRRRDSLGGFFEAMGANTFHQLEVRDVIADGDRVVARVALGAGRTGSPPPRCPTVRLSGVCELPGHGPRPRRAR